jgi:YD repeat-containing protein
VYRVASAATQNDFGRKGFSMVAVVSGNGLGLTNTSLGHLGSRGGVGTAGLGQGGTEIFVNSATGNLVVQGRDEFLAATGADLSLHRTYNSQGLLNDDNGDNWRLGLHRRVYNLTGTVNTAGSKVTKVFGDGSEAVYTYNTALARYVGTDGEGAHDSLSWSGTNNQWTWTDGSARNTETYDATGKLIQTRDQDGNTATYAYTGALLTQVTDSSGQATFLDYAGNNLTQIRTVIAGATQTRTRYAYDASNRLASVTVDLSPADNSIADGKTFVTTYTYDGTSKRIAAITHSDGTTVSFT